MLAETAQTAVPLPSPMHWLEAASVVVVYVVNELRKERGAKKHTATTKRERNEELDQRLNSVRDAIGLAQQSNVMEFGKLGTRLDRMEGSVETVKSEVAGLRQRELDRLESSAGLPRRRKR